MDPQRPYEPPQPPSLPVAPPGVPVYAPPPAAPAPFPPFAYGAPPAYGAGAPGYPGVMPYYVGPPPRPRLWTVFVTFICALVAGFMSGGFVAVIAAVATGGVTFDPAGGADPEAAMNAAVMRPAVLLPALLTTQLAFIAVAGAAAMLSPVPWRRRLRLVRARLPWYGYPIVALGTLALGLGSGILIEMVGLGEEGVLEEFEKAIAGMRGLLLFTAAAVIGLAPGFGEEVLFRGYMQTRLVQRWPRLLAIFVTAVLFGVMHMDVVQGAFAICMGLFVGEVVERTGSIWPAIVGHAFNNASATVMGALMGSEAAAVEAAGEAATQAAGVSAGGDEWWGLGICAAVFLLAVLYVVRRPVVPVEDEPMPPAPAPYPYPYAAPPGTPGAPLS